MLQLLIVEYSSLRLIEQIHLCQRNTVLSLTSRSTNIHSNSRAAIAAAMEMVFLGAFLAIFAIGGEIRGHCWLV